MLNIKQKISTQIHRIAIRQFILRHFHCSPEDSDLTQCCFFLIFVFNSLMHFFPSVDFKNHRVTLKSNNQL